MAKVTKQAPAGAKKQAPAVSNTQSAPERPCVGAMFSNDTLNVGDENSNPVHYFSFGRDVVKADWPTMRRKYVADNLILGGGFLSRMFDGDTTYFDVAAEVKKVFVWGIGLNPHKPPNQRVLDRCTLVGIREFGHTAIDNEKVMYVPCSSCMSPLFDLDWEVPNEHVFFMHSHASKIADRLNIDAPVINNRLDFVTTIQHIASGKTVVTNSYHGAYWATLLNRKVVVIAEPGQWDTFRPEKFECFKFPPAFAQPENWRDAAASARTYPDALADSRRANLAFYRKVLGAMSW